MLTYGLLLVTGFLGSFGHCAGMCGGFVLTYSLNLASPEGPQWRPAFHLAYNLGRVYTYALIGGLAGALGQGIVQTSNAVAIRSLVPILAGVAMVVLGLARAGLIRPLGAAPGGVAAALVNCLHFLGRLVHGRSLGHLFALGLFNGLLPCGLSYSVALMAVGAGSFFKGFLTMAVFGLGTVPGLFLLGTSSAVLGSRLRGHVFRLAGFLVAALGLLSIARGLDMAGQAALFHRCSPYL